MISERMRRNIATILEDEETGEHFVKIPDWLIAEADLMEGDEIEFGIDGDTITIDRSR